MGDFVERVRAKRARIAVVGLGYVGLPLAVQFARSGFNVIGIDVDPRRVNDLNEGLSHIKDVREIDLQEVVKSGLLKATSDFSAISRSDAVIVCVPTPLGPHKEPDTTYIENACEAAAPHFRNGQLIVLESTTYPGTTEEIVVPRIRARGLEPGRDVHVAFSPERIDPGNERFRVQNIPKVVGGLTAECSEASRALYESGLGVSVHVVSSPRAAEMTKLLENIFRIVNVSLVNELAQLAERMDVDIWEVIGAASTKPFGYMPFYPGPGMGGHCIPVDAFYLSWKAKEYHFTTRFIELAGEINDGMPEYVTARAAEILNESAKPFRDARILVLGMAYKKDVGDVRESPASAIASKLIERGARLEYHDPHVPEVRLQSGVLRSVTLDDQRIASADLVLILTDHSAVDYSLVARHAKVIYDTRNAIRGPALNVRRLGAPPATPPVASEDHA